MNDEPSDAQIEAAVKAFWQTWDKSDKDKHAVELRNLLSHEAMREALQAARGAGLRAWMDAQGYDE